MRSFKIKILHGFLFALTHLDVFWIFATFSIVKQCVAQHGYTLGLLHGFSIIQTVWWLHAYTPPPIREVKLQPPALPPLSIHGRGAGLPCLQCSAEYLSPALV